MYLHSSSFRKHCVNIILAFLPLSPGIHLLKSHGPTTVINTANLITGGRPSPLTVRRTRTRPERATMVHAQQPSTLSAAPTVVDPNNGQEKESPVNSVIYSTSPTARFPDNSENYRPEPHREASMSPSLLPPYIPYEARAGKMLVICFDGTGDQFDADNSNIVQLVTMLKKDDKTKQMVYYQVRISFLRGPHSDSLFIGWHWDVCLTGSSYAVYVQGVQSESFPFRFQCNLSRGRNKTLDEMLAWNLDAHVMGMCHDFDFGAKIVLNKFAGGYEFLMQNCMSYLLIHPIWA